MFTISKNRLAFGAAAFAILAPAAHAGGFVAPVVPTPVIAPEVQTAPAWAGAYAGGSLGYSLGGDDEIGLELFEAGVSAASASDLGTLELSGPTLGLNVGYRWQRDRWVFGPELGLEFGGVDDSEDLVEEELTVGSELNNLLSLRFKAGYLVDDRTMVFGSGGAVRGDFDYSIAADGESYSEGYTATGYSVGLGVERKMNDRMSLTAEWEYRNFGTTDVDFVDPAGSGDFLRTVATPEHHNVKLGVNFNF